MEQTFGLCNEKADAKIFALRGIITGRDREDQLSGTIAEVQRGCKTIEISI